jgi:hypothetical protein
MDNSYITWSQQLFKFFGFISTMPIMSLTFQVLKWIYNNMFLFWLLSLWLQILYSISIKLYSYIIPF